MTANCRKDDSYVTWSTYTVITEKL